MSSSTQSSYASQKYQDFRLKFKTEVTVTLGRDADIGTNEDSVPSTKWYSVDKAVRLRPPLTRTQRQTRTQPTLQNQNLSQLQNPWLL